MIQLGIANGLLDHWKHSNHYANGPAFAYMYKYIFGKVKKLLLNNSSLVDQKCEAPSHDFYI